MSLAIILLNWKDEDRVIRRVRELQLWQRVNPEIIVVDNESTTASAHKLRAALTACRVLASPVNRGFGGGNNLGLKAALANSCDLILLLNTDAWLSEDAALQLIEVMSQHPEAGILSPTIQEVRDGVRYDLIGGRNIAFYAGTKTLVRSGTASPTATRLQRVHHVSGTVFLIRRDVLERVGLLDEAYFFSGEIADLCHRAGKLGFASFVDRHASATHDLGQTEPGLRDGLYAYYSLRNRFLFVRRHYGAHALWLSGYWLLVGGLELAKSLALGRTRRARGVWLALVHGLRSKYGNRNAALLAHEHGPTPARSGFL